MNSSRSFLDSLNDGRQRRPASSLEDLRRTIAALEERLRMNDDGIAPAATVSEETLSRRSRRLIGDERPVTEWRQESTEAPAAAIAHLDGIRSELREQLASGLRDEFDGLRSEIARSLAEMRPASPHSDTLNAELEQLSQSIHSLAARGDAQSVDELRQDLDALRGALNQLARQETLRSLEDRWDAFDRRFAEMERRIPNDRAFESIGDHLSRISDAIGDLPHSQTMHSLEENVRSLATAIDHFSRYIDHAPAHQSELIEERLDEISRALAAATAVYSHPPSNDQLERIEARIASLAQQIEEVVQDRMGDELAEKIALLSKSVDEISSLSEWSRDMMVQLADQLATIRERLDTIDSEAMVERIEHRFAEAVAYLEERQAEASARGDSHFEALDARLEDISRKMDNQPIGGATGEPAILEQMDRRFAELSDHIARNGGEVVASRMMEALDRRLDAIASRLDDAGNRPALDTDLVRNLETQLADLTAHLSRTSPGHVDLDEIKPQLAGIERSLVDQRDTLIEAARQAALEAVRSFNGTKNDADHASALAEELRALEALARRSDDRNTRTFEAIHDTLLKVVDRLAALEQPAPGASDDFAPEPRNHIENAPSIEPVEEEPDIEALETATMPLVPLQRPRTPQEAAAAAASAAVEEEAPQPNERGQSLLGGLARMLPGRKKGQASEIPSDQALDPVFAEVEDSADEMRSETTDSTGVDPEASIADTPLEPGSGAPDINAIMRRVRNERAKSDASHDPVAARADFIAAARRAAQAAAAEAETLKKDTSKGNATRKFAPVELLRARRKPVLMAATAIILALAGLQIGKVFMKSGERQALLPQEAAAPTVAEAPASPEIVAAEPEAEPADAVVADDLAATPSSDTIAEDQDATIETAAVPAPVVQEPAEPAAKASADAQTPAAGQSDETAALRAFEPAPTEAGPAALREAANAGDAKAMFEIGRRYDDGRGVAADAAQAAVWYERAAEGGLAPAQYRIGNAYEKGLGVERDVEKAKQWYRSAADQGNASAMHNLAVLHAMGADGSTDNEAAARWFLKAAELGVKDSQFNMGILSAKGVGVPQSLEESYKWFALVAMTGDKDAESKRDDVAKALRPEQLERARAAAELWQAKPLDKNANSVDVPEAWRTDAAPTASIDLSRIVSNVQSILNKNGYDAGPADGIIGQKTRDAVMAFQKEHGMNPTGKVDPDFVKALLKAQ